MDQQTLSEFETFLFDRCERAVVRLPEVVGVLIDLKPAAVLGIPRELWGSEDMAQIEQFLEKLALNPLVVKRSLDTEVRDIYISKNPATARELKGTFETLWATMNRLGKTVDRDGWRQTTIQLGRLLGYPETAVQAFASEDQDHGFGDDPERQARMARNRYYAHSAAHEEEEFAAYDQVLNSAIDQYLPRTAAVLQESGKRWN